MVLMQLLREGKWDEWLEAWELATIIIVPTFPTMRTLHKHHHLPYISHHENYIVGPTIIIVPTFPTMGFIILPFPTMGIQLLAGAITISIVGKICNSYLPTWDRGMRTALFGHSNITSLLTLKHQTQNCVFVKKEGRLRMWVWSDIWRSLKNFN